MSMKLTKITTHWSAADAHMMISFLDELKDALWDTYGEDIIKVHQAEQVQGNQTGSMEEDDIIF